MLVSYPSRVRRPDKNKTKNNNIDHIGVIDQQNEQQNHVGVPDNNLQPQNDRFGGIGEHHSDANDDNENDNKHIHISDDDGSNTDYNGNGNNSNDSQQHSSDSQGDLGSESEDINIDDNSESSQYEIDQSEDPVSLSRHHSTIGGLLNRGNNTGLDGSHWGAEGSWLHTCHMITATVVAEQVSVRMMIEYFKIEASKSTP